MSTPPAGMVPNATGRVAKTIPGPLAGDSPWPKTNWWPKPPEARRQQSDNLVARVDLPNMQSSEQRKVEVYAEAVRGLLELEQDGDRRANYIEFIDIYAGLTDNEYWRYQQQYREESSAMAGIISRAREEGMQQGMQRGRVQGERALLERLLRRRCGLLSPEIAARLGQASAADVECWAENVLNAPTLDDVFDSSR